MPRSGAGSEYPHFGSPNSPIIPEDFAVSRARLVATLFLAFTFTGISISTMTDSVLVKATLGWQ
ncbi:hypothetical protein ABZY68_22470 [Streptomyces sp. NPDC006482]|uniref:hypothetical protein n=1 Tax=unclassified Streptomyces TaxID=2593676 RepID=UPI00224F520E|nr:hypothetical protein [Streptomyces sp. NBC_00094]MCX5393842.1 hypothetical protein [Streptomyces sp. NBC_00094]